MSLKYLVIPFFMLAVCACSGDEPEQAPEPESPEVTPTQPETPDQPDQPDVPLVKPCQYRVAQLTIDTKDAAAVESKEKYVKCSVKIECDSTEWCFEATGGIRGRGNSSWLWYDKKPYRIKLDKKASLMGMGEGKSWVLLANYRDPTDLMNTFVFELGNLAGLPYTNHTRYVELTLNGTYLGLYQLTEQVQQGKGRVNVDEASGYLLSLDADDGPELSPGAGDNFWSEVYRMPVCIKNPENLDAARIADIRAEFGVLEAAIKAGDYDRVKALMDVQSYIDFVIIQELIYNVELAAPRSMYIHKDTNGLWTMGPLWDFDAGYDFDWSNMYTGHTYFSDYRETVLGTDPSQHKGTAYDVPRFFSDLFKVKEFTSDYKSRWKQIHLLVTEAWQRAEMYVDDEAWQRDYEKWPIGKRPEKEIPRMQSWIANRSVYLNNIVSNYRNETPPVIHNFVAHRPHSRCC